MRKTPIVITEHAVDRYRERLAPDLPREDARVVLQRRLDEAELMFVEAEQREYWFRGSPRGRAIVKRDPKQGDLTCVTVKPASFGQIAAASPRR